MALTSIKMAPTIFVLALVILAKFSANYANPTGIKANHDWPKECENRNYCWIKTKAYKNLKETFEKLLRGEKLDYMVGAETPDRQSDARDVAHCNSYPMFEEITMIRDKNNTIWYVPQTANYSIAIQIVECTDKNRIVSPKASGLDAKRLQDKKVQCVEQKVHFQFPVLSQDQSKMESEPLAPYKGLPLYCSAKIIK